MLQTAPQGARVPICVGRGRALALAVWEPESNAVRMGSIDETPTVRGGDSVPGDTDGAGGLESRVLLARARARQSQRDADRLDFGVTSLFDLALEPADAMAERHEHVLLLQALRRIPIEHQTLLELYFWEPLPALEIASVLGVPEGTVRTRIRRAKAVLEVELGRLTDDPKLFESTVSNLEDWARQIRARSG